MFNFKSGGRKKNTLSSRVSRLRRKAAKKKKTNALKAEEKQLRKFLYGS